MANAPSFQFYANDFITGTQDWSVEEVGIYIRLLCYQWDKGQLPNEENRLARISGCDLDTFKKAWVFVGLKFLVNDGHFIKNERLERTREEQLAFREKQRLNGSKGGRPKNTETQKKPKQNPTVNPNHNPKETSSSSSYIKKEIYKEKIPSSTEVVFEYMKSLNDWEDSKCKEQSNTFFDHFKSNGWKVGGKTPMIDWQAAVRNWVRRNKDTKENLFTTKIQELPADHF